MIFFFNLNKIPQFFFRYFILDYLISSGLFPEMYQGIEFDPSAR